MEIKVTCPCGTRYKFPVEPVEGRLPHAIACPVCGADNTEVGNLMIQEQLGGSAPPPPPASPSGGLRLAAHTPSTPPPAASAPPPRPSPVMSRPTRPTSSGDGGMAKVKKVLSVSLTVILVAIGVFAIYSKWSRRIRGVSSLIEAVGSSESDEKKVRWTLPDDNGSALLVKSDSHTNVAATLATAYSQLAKRPMRVVTNADEADEDAEFGVLPAINGAVHVGGPMEWPVAQATNLAATLSKQLHTLVVLAVMGDDAETGQVSIYEDGERRFYVRHWMEIKSLTEDGIKEFTERDGDAWAATHGYVPGPTNYASSDKMAFEDVNQLVLNLGIDVSEPPEEIKDVLVVKPAGPAGAARSAAARK